jgi:murein DD-endopeptidase MepM/ murein hydrolase activator NlpD
LLAPIASAASVEASWTSARAGVAAVRGWHAPLDGTLDVLRPFRPPAHVWLPGHRGVDLAASPGTAVRAAGEGIVTWASVLVGRGVVVVLHPDGRRTTYEPVDASVTVGEHVVAGQVIGGIGTGDTHCGGLPSCLHWGLRRGRAYLDPWHLLHPGHPVLLPP